MHLGLITNRSRDEGLCVARPLIRWLRERGVRITLDPELARDFDEETTGLARWPRMGMDFIIVLGGDGTLLHTARRTHHLGLPLLGVNLGRLGFLTEIELSELYEDLPNSLEGRYERDHRHLMKATIFRNEDCVEEFLALNDVVIGKGSFSRMVDIRAWVDGALMGKYRADGIILSTATGSTAYSLSAGGPIVHPRLKVLVVTPVCPHSFYARPVVLSENQVVKIRGDYRHQDGHPLLTVDGRRGRSLVEGDTVDARLSDRTITLLRHRGWNFYEVLQRKFSNMEGTADW